MHFELSETVPTATPLVPYAAVVHRHEHMFRFAGTLHRRVHPVADSSHPRRLDLLRRCRPAAGPGQGGRAPGRDEALGGLDYPRLSDRGTRLAHQGEDGSRGDELVGPAAAVDGQAPTSAYPERSDRGATSRQRATTTETLSN